MKKWTLLIGLVTLTISMAGSAFAQDDFNFPGRLRQLDAFLPNSEEPAPTFIKSGQAGFTFLSIPTDARTAGMADAGIGIVGHAGGIMSNPAALAFFDGREAYFSSVQWIADTDLLAGGVTVNAPGKGTFGLAFQTYNFGDVRTTVIDPNPAGDGWLPGASLSPTNYAVSFAYGLKITDRFSVGASAKLAHQDLGSGDIFVGSASKVDNSKTVLGLDLATYFNTGFRNTALAMTVRNFSTELQYQVEQFELPRQIQIGVLVDVISMMERTPAPHHLDLAVDLSNPIDFSERILFGLEYRFQTPGSSLGYSVRGGYKTNHDTEDYSVGAGIRFKNESGKGFRVDYAYRHFNGSFFNSVNIISGGVTF